MIWFVSDTHYYHYKEFLKRPFLGPEMDELLISNWNSVVTPKDQVWHLGDFGYKLKGEVEGTADKLSSLNSIFNKLNGDKHQMAGWASCKIGG